MRSIFFYPECTLGHGGIRCACHVDFELQVMIRNIITLARPVCARAKRKAVHKAQALINVNEQQKMLLSQW